MKKIIGVTPRIMYEENVEKQFVNTRYFNFLKTLNIQYLMLPLDTKAIDNVLNLCDGFLITGGDDLEPATYNQVNQGLSKNCDQRLDNIDFEVIKYCLQTKKPILGICRGLQSLNVFFNGTLHQDDENHKVIKNHDVKIIASRYFDDLTITTNSYHHQTIDVLGEDLDIFAISGDGVIEGISHKYLPIIAIQWHPEISMSAFDKQILETFKKALE